MSDLVAIGYDDVATAQQVAANAVEAQKAHIIDLDDMVVVERREDGSVKLHQPSAAGAGAKIPGKIIQTSLDDATEERMGEALAAAGQQS
jgi:uncharacterized membrane protein